MKHIAMIIGDSRNCWQVRLTQRNNIVGHIITPIAAGRKVALHLWRRIWVK